MKGRGHHAPLPHPYRVFSVAGQHLDSGTHLLDARGPDEYHLQRLRSEAGYSRIHETVGLAAISVTPNYDVDPTQPGLCGIFNLPGQQYGSGACTERGFGSDESP